MTRGEVWFADTGQGGDRPVLVLTRDPVADRINRIVVAQVTNTVRGVLSEMPLGPSDGLRDECVVSFDNLHTLHRSVFRRRVAIISSARLEEACAVMNEALGCSH